MELQALLVLCGLGVAGAAVLLLMGLFSTSGTSYEEAMAQQRKATTELLALAEGKNKPKKNTKKANKKLAKKEKHKDSVSAATGSEPESEAPAESGADDEAPPPKPHVEFRPPVVVDIPRDTPPNVKIRKRGKDPKVKPILLNKEDPSCVSDPSSPPSPAGSSLSNHFEDIHPKDEFELLHSALAAEKAAEKKEEVIEKKEVGKGNKQAKGKQGKGQPPAPAPAPAAATEPVKEEPAPLPERKPAEQPKDQRKAKKDKKAVVEAVEPEVREEVVPPLNVPQPSELTTEKLLKQVAAAPHPPHAPQAAPAHTPPPKNKKKKQEPNLLALIAAEGGGVNVSELVRLVREASLSRTEIQILTDALLNKQHDPLPQHSEWSEGPNDPMQKMKKQLADKEKALADELEASQALHAKLKELRASLNAERARAGAMARAAEEAAGEAHALQARLQRAADDNHALAQEKLMLQSKLAAEAEAQAQRVQNMEMHIQRLSESEASLVAQLAALQGEAGARAHEAAAARCELAAARDAALHAQQHAAELAQQLQEANRVCAELDAQRQSALLAEQAAAQDARAASERLAALSELQGEVQRLKSRAQLAEAATEKAKEEAEKLKQQLSAEVSSLREQLAAREAELAELRALKAAPAHNGLPAPAPAPSADLKAGELSKVEGVVAALRAELAAARAQSREQQEGAALLAAQLQAYQDKNNDLRTKNWKVMEALQSAEKALQSKPHAMPAQDSLREALSKAEAAQYSEVAAILGAACPTAAPTAAPGKAWLQAFAEQLRAQLAAPAPAPAPTPAPAPSDDLRAQNEHLQGLVDKYKTIIDDTEGVLSRLQQNVTCEERRWAAQLADKQRELDELRQRTVTQMQSKIDALEEELRQRNERNNISSFGETQKEDRLMAELSKNKLDTLNGPLQVGVEKK